MIEHNYVGHVNGEPSIVVRLNYAFGERKGKNFDAQTTDIVMINLMDELCARV